jgi:hypothetical protein
MCFVPSFWSFAITSYCKSIAIVFWLFATGLCFALGATEQSEATGQQASSFIWWSAGAAERMMDGGTEQALTLLASPATAIERPEAWLRVRAAKSSQPVWFKGEWSPSDPCRLVVRSNEYATVDVFARAEVGGQPCFAQTRLMLYGQGNDGGTRGEAHSEGPGWPEFSASIKGESSYWPQTGHEFSLRLSVPNATENDVMGNMEIWSGQGEQMDAAPLSGDGYKYVPPHDPALNRAGTSAAKPLIFLVRLNDGGSASYTQIVHRSRYGLWDKNAGMALFAAAIVASGITAWLVRRKGRPCC